MVTGREGPGRPLAGLLLADPRLLAACRQQAGNVGSGHQRLQRRTVAETRPLLSGTCLSHPCVPPPLTAPCPWAAGQWLMWGSGRSSPSGQTGPASRCVGQPCWAGTRVPAVRPACGKAGGAKRRDMMHHSDVGKRQPTLSTSTCTQPASQICSPPTLQPSQLAHCSDAAHPIWSAGHAKQPQPKQTQKPCPEPTLIHALRGTTQAGRQPISSP